MSRTSQAALCVVAAAAGVALATLASATPGPGGWDNLGTGATPTAPAFNGAVYALEPVSGVLYAGGAFTNAGGDASADYLAQWSNGSWTGVGAPPLTGAVNAIAFRNGNLYVGGTFTNAGGNANADFLAVWDGKTWGTVCDSTGPALNGNVTALQIVGTTIYVGGTFSDAAGIASADALVACDLGTGAARSTVGTSPAFGGPVYALATDGSGTLYAGGNFTNLTGIAAADYVASYSGGTWHALGSGSGTGGGAVEGIVRSLAGSGANVYIGTDAVNVAGIPQADHAARWNGTAWSALGSNTAGNDGYLPTASTTIDALRTSGSRVFVGGTFTNADGDPLADDVAEFSSGAWSPIGSNGAGNGALNANVRALTTFAQDLVAGGSFTNAGGNDLADFAATYPLAGAPPVTTTTTTTPTTTTGAPPPTAKATGTVLVNGQPFVSGTILYRSVVDVSRGRLVLQADTGTLTLKGAGGQPASFMLIRGRDKQRRSLIEFRLTGGDFAVCPTPKKTTRKKSGATRIEATTVRRLWGNGIGRFRTRGRYSAATVRGTRWFTADRCDGTLTKVVTGELLVTDFPRRRQVVVRAGRSYLARP